MKSRILKSYRKLVAHPNPWWRRLIGIGLVIGGILGPVLPLLGVWMLPLGIIVLIIDLPQLRPLRRRYNAWWRRNFWERRKKPQAPGNTPPDTTG